MNPSIDAHLAQVLGDRQVSPIEKRLALLKRSILSISGLRFIHSEDEQDLSTHVPKEVLEFVLCAVVEHVSSLLESSSKPIVVLGMDARPTGPQLMNLAYRTIRAMGAEVRCVGMAPIPQVMAATHRHGCSGFVYFTASHNPPGHNGLKLGHGDGAVLAAAPAKRLIERLKAAYADESHIKTLLNRLQGCREAVTPELDRQIEHHATKSLDTYRNFVLDTLSLGRGCEALLGDLKSYFSTRRAHFVYDMNGSSRIKSADLALLKEIGLECHLIGGVPGKFEHAIVPEGASLRPCTTKMQELMAAGHTVFAGMVPDCDGDRGNLILPVSGKATALAAQQTFALCALGEVAAQKALSIPGQRAIVGNDATSLRVDQLLAPFGVEVFRAETGEANVLALAAELRKNGRIVSLSGEGSNGGNITHPSTVRDPLMTLVGIMRFVASAAAATAFKTLGRPLPKKADLESLLKLLPVWNTTDAFEGEALMPVPAIEHNVLKSRYEELLSGHFEKHPDFWSELGVEELQWVNYEGILNIVGPGNRPAPGRGGTAALLRQKGKARGFLWMRGSGTEPVFRVIADWSGTPAEYRKLIELHRHLIEQAAR